MVVIDVSYHHHHHIHHGLPSRSATANASPANISDGMGYFDTSLGSEISASSQYVNVIKLIDTIAYLEFFQFAMCVCVRLVKIAYSQTERCAGYFIKMEWCAWVREKTHIQFKWWFMCNFCLVLLAHNDLKLIEVAIQVMQCIQLYGQMLAILCLSPCKMWI